MPAHPTDPDLADFLDEVAWTPPVVARAAHKLLQWQTWLAGRGVKTLDADRKDLRAWLAEREAAGRGPATRKKDWQIVTAFYRWAATPPRKGGGGLLADDPMATVKPPKVPARPTTRAARPVEVDAIEDHLAKTVARRRGGGEGERARRNLVMVSLMFRSGCRPGELPWIDLDDVVTRADGRTVIKLWPDHVKTREPRLVPVAVETARYLRRYLRARGTAPGPLFLGREAHTKSADRRMTAGAVTQVVKRAANAVGVPVTSYQLRRGWTGNYLRAGGDVLSLEVIGGWADHRMPRRYLADDEAEAALERYWAVTEDHQKSLP